MSDQNTQDQSTETAEKEPSGQKIMCYVSKQMVPMEDTEELEYAPGKSVRVQSRYIKFER